MTKTNEIITIEKSYRTKENEVFAFSFEGLGHPDTKYLEKLLDRCFKQFLSYRDMLRNIEYIRTILKNYKEQCLVVSLLRPSQIKEQELDIIKVTYNKQKLEKLEINEIKTDENKYPAKFIFTYEFGKITTNIPGTDFKFIKNNICEYLKKYDELTKAKPYLEPEIEVNRLIEIYKLFYNEIPDFSSKNINLKVQTMLCILLDYDGISISDDEDYRFEKYEHMKYPCSPYIGEILKGLVPFGRMEEGSYKVKIPEETARIIKALGSVIKEYESEGCDKLDILTALSTIIYLKTNKLPPNDTTDKISKSTGYSKKTITKYLKKLSKLDN